MPTKQQMATYAQASQAAYAISLIPNTNNSLLYQRDAKGSTHMRRITICTFSLLATTTITGCSKYALDRQMEALCKKDGGVKVYETVSVSPAEYLAMPQFRAIAKSQEEYYGPEYRYVEENKTLVGTANGPQNGRGRLSRSHQSLFRKADGRMLGESVMYWRVGGDFFTFGFMPSSNHCPDTGADVAQSVFVRGN
jgi:hypothetical protein